MAKRNEITELGRCPWAKAELYVLYHDSEWGVPVHDDRLLFEFLILEGAQAGLSWATILKKRDNYRAAFDQFEPAIVARYGKRKQASLLADAGIVRNRLKIESAILNAKHSSLCSPNSTRSTCISGSSSGERKSKMLGPR
jgi:DNA-3-methyladenine glycosylase I